MKFLNILLLTVGVTSVAAAGTTTTGAASATKTMGAGGGKGSGGKATGTSSGKSTKTSGIVLSTGAANSLLGGGKKELVTVAGLGVAFAVMM